MATVQNEGVELKEGYTASNLIDKFSLIFTVLVVKSRIQRIRMSYKQKNIVIQNQALVVYSVNSATPDLNI